APGDVLRDIPHAALAGECEPGAPADRDRLHRGRAPRPSPPRGTGNAGPLGRHRADRGRRGPGLTHLTRAGAALAVAALAVALAGYVRPETLFVAALAWGFALVLNGVAEGRRGRVAAGLAAFGVAALAKDPVGALAPPLAIGTALALASRARPLGRWLPLPGVFACLALSFAWWPAVERRTPGFVWYTVIDNHVLN